MRVPLVRVPWVSFVSSFCRVTPSVGAPLAGALRTESYALKRDPGGHFANNSKYVPENGSPSTRAPEPRAPARGTPTDDVVKKRSTQIRWAQKPNLGDIIGAYKSIVAYECLNLWKTEKHPDELLGKVWQRNYWEHVIRDTAAYDNIETYIVNNPSNWSDDMFYSTL